MYQKQMLLNIVIRLASLTHAFSVFLDINYYKTVNALKCLDHALMDILVIIIIVKVR